jgi:hypothetical protein
MNTPEERNEIERMENEGGRSAWWNDTTRNEPFTNPAARNLMLEKIREARDNLRRVQHSISDKHFPKVTAKNRGEFKPYLAYSYAGQGWVEVLSEAQGQPPRRLCKWPTCDATFLVPDSLLQGAPATGD